MVELSLHQIENKVVNERSMNYKELLELILEYVGTMDMKLDRLEQAINERAVEQSIAIENLAQQLEESVERIEAEYKDALYTTKEYD